MSYEQLRIATIAKFNFPTDYGKIEETDLGFRLLKRTDTDVIGHFPIKSTVLSIGYHPKSAKFFLHSVFYPKDHYSKKMIELIGLALMECPHCVQGTHILEMSTSEKQVIKYVGTQKEHDEPMASPITKFWGKLTVEERRALREEMVEAIPSGILGLIGDAFSKNPLGQKIAKLVIGGVGLYASFHIPSAKFRRVARRSTIPLLATFYDPTKEQFEELKQNVRDVKGIWKMGAKEVGKYLFRNPFSDGQSTMKRKTSMASTVQLKDIPLISTTDPTKIAFKIIKPP